MADSLATFTCRLYRNSGSLKLLDLFRTEQLLHSYRLGTPNDIHTTSLKCCLPATDANDRREKIHACAIRIKVGSCKRARL